MHGPTLNPIYNDLLIRWANSGHPSPPECEDCERDLTGQEVFEVNHGWVCEDCSHNHNPPSPCILEREDFHADG